MRSLHVALACALALVACSSPSSDDESENGTTGTQAGAAGQVAAGTSSGAGGVTAGSSATAGMQAAAGSAGTSANAGEGGSAGTSAGMQAAGSGTAGNAGSSSDAGASGAAGAAGTTAGDAGGEPNARCEATLSSDNRMLVSQAIDELFVDKDITAVDRYWSDPYLQHNPIAQSGVTTFRNLFGSILSSPSFTYQRYLTLADCDLAVIYGRYSQTGVIFDMFRVMDGKIMEHWDSEGGAAAPGDLPAHDTSASSADTRALFLAFAEAVLVGGATDRASEFLGESYLEHAGDEGTGPTAFTAYLQAEDISYTQVHHVIADGNYVFALSEGTRGSSDYGFYDLFRVQDGKLAEHWTAERAVPSSTQSGLGIF